MKSQKVKSTRPSLRSPQGPRRCQGRSQGRQQGWRSRRAKSNPNDFPVTKKDERPFLVYLRATIPSRSLHSDRGHALVPGVEVRPCGRRAQLLAHWFTTTSAESPMDAVSSPSSAGAGNPARDPAPQASEKRISCVELVMA